MNTSTKSITAFEVKVYANPGASLTQCMRDCIILAMYEWRDVILTHNTRTYKFTAEDLFNTHKIIKE